MQREIRLNRRHFLVGVASTAGAAILAACGSGTASTATTVTSTTAAKATTAPATAAASAASTTTTTGSASVAAGSTAAAASTTGVIATAAPAIPANTKFKLTVAIKNNTPAEVDLMQKVVDLYKADRPNADVAVLGYDQATYDQKLLTDISGGTLPDVFTCNDVYNKPFFQNGLIADLKPLAAKTGFKLDDFDPQFLGLADYQGKIGFLPRAADVVVLYYNKRLFDEAKVKYPDSTWTMNDLLTASQQLTKKAPDGTITQYGFTANYTTWSIWVPIVVAEGAKILSDDGKKAIFDSPEGIRGWNYIFTGLKNGSFVPPSVQTTMGGPNVPFMNGKAAMAPAVRSLTPNARAQLKDDWDVALIPKGTVDRKSGMGTTGYAIGSKVKNPDAAWDFMQYLFTKGLQVFMQSYLVVPPIKTFYNDAAWRNLPPPPANNDIFVSATQTAMLPPSLPFYSTGPFLKAMTDGVDAVLLGKTTPEQAVKNMAVQATASLQA
ncbi:MAG: sugar ABC transporter substrate-binding protein [Chloroflexota bacterium]|nr:sugar ABC transporter substrate-binding protein [Chloroflexota bacterium]